MVSSELGKEIEKDVILSCREHGTKKISLVRFKNMTPSTLLILAVCRTRFI